MERERISIAPQDGPQAMFLSTAADIAIYGGSAGGGKSYALLLEPLRHHQNAKFGAVVFRRNATQVRNEGGLWDESCQVYPLLGAKPREISLEWKFPSGMRVSFAHLEYDKTVLEWQGAQIPLICFDELTHFTEQQFFYMLSRNRSSSGVKGYVRASTNPDSESWVRALIDWWIGTDGLPIKERSGVLRWFIRDGNEMLWGDSREELVEKYGAHQQPKSLTFISAKLADNKILMQKDPGYLANLMSLDRVERARLLEGNWNTKASSGMYFRRDYFKIVEAVNANVISQCRYWDRAATAPSEANKNPDFTVGVKLVKLHTGIWVITDVIRLRDTPLKVEQAILNTASQDGYECPVVLEQDPGSAGVSEISHLTRLLAGYNVRVRKPTKDKITRASPVSAQCEAGNVYVLKAKWNDVFLQEAENFPPESSGHDDQIDALSGAFNELAVGGSILDVL